MKKLIITFLLCGWALNLYALPPFFSYGGGGTVSGQVNVSNDAYNATTWDNDGLNAPSRNAVRDKFESLDGDYQPLDTDLTDLATGSPTGTYDLSGATITFGLEASDIPDISGTYATAEHDHTGTYEPADATIMKTGSYANLTAINAVSPSSGYLRYNGSAFVYDTPSGTEHDAVTLGVDADTILGLSTQQITLDTQTANYVFAGPATGEAADPTFRALVAEDIPDLSGTYQTADTELAAIAALENGSGVLTNDGSGGLSWVAGGGSMVYPGAGVPFSTGSAWGTSLTVGTGASNLVQLDESGKLPAVDGSSLTGLFDPAAPGAIGGTTPNTGAFTTITVDEIAISKKSGEPSHYLLYEAETVSTMGVGAIGPDNVASTYYVKEPDALPAGSIAVYGTPAEESVPNLGTVAVSDKAWLDVTTSIDEESTNTEIPTAAAVESRIDSKIAGIEIPEGSGLPEGGTEGQIIIRGAESAGWGNGDDVAISYSPTDEYTNTDSTLAGHLAGIAAELAALKLQITTMTEAFNALGLNAFFFTPSTPASYPYYSDTGTFDLFFTITDSSPTYNIYSARYQLNEDGYDGNPLVITEGNIWRASLANLDEGSYTLQLEADDDKSPVRNVGESSEYTVVVDTTDPVINLSAGANPTTHDGSGTDTWDLQIGMIEELHTALIQYRLTVDGGETPEWSTWSSPWTTTGISLPEVDEDLHIAVKVTDLAGNWDTGGITVPVSGGGGDYLVQEDFEGTGTPAGWTQFGSRPLPNFDYTTTVLEGSESAYFSGSGYSNDAAVATPTQTAGTDRYTAFMYRMSSISTADVTTLEICNGSTTLGSLKQWINGALIAKLTGGTEAYSAPGVISINTTYYTKVRWQAGSPAVLTVWISSDGQNWTQAVQANDVNITDGMTHVVFRSQEDAGVAPIIDDVRISDDDINY